MSPSKVRVATIVQKSTLVDGTLDGLATLPLDGLEDFRSDPRDAAAAESCLRRALEALVDLGPRILAKAISERTLEYKQIAVALGRSACWMRPARVCWWSRPATGIGVRTSTTRSPSRSCTTSAQRTSQICSVRDTMPYRPRRHPEAVDGEL